MDHAGGVEVFNEQLSRCLPGVTILSFPKARVGNRGGLDSVGLDHPLRAWAVSRAFYRAHQRDPFRFVICNGLYGWPVALLPPAIPVVQVYHYTVAGLARQGIRERGIQAKMLYVESVFDRVAGKGKHVVAVGRNVLDEVRRYYGHDGRVIPNGVDLELFRRRDRIASRRELGLPPNARIGLFVGRAEYAKGFDILQEVIRAVPDTLFLVVGGSVQPSRNAIIHPRVPRARMPIFYSAADFLILPSRYEGFNLTILEALACGLPILVSRAAYALEDDSHGIGLVVDSLEPEAYIAALQRLPERSDGEDDRERTAAKYSLDRFREAWRGLADELIAVTDEHKP